MKHLLWLSALCVVAAAAIPSNASAWTHCGTPQAESDCPPITTCINGVETQVPDNGQYTEGECPPPPPKTVTVCLNGETVTVPENEMPAGATEGECQPVVPPPNPPETEVPPTPPVDTPPDDTAPVEEDTPEVDIGTPGGPEKGGQVLGLENDTPQPEAQVQETSGSTLPYTGAPAGLVLLAGAMVGLGGLAIRRLVR